jgi:hypothetical protein
VTETIGTVDKHSDFSGKLGSRLLGNWVHNLGLAHFSLL